MYGSLPISCKKSPTPPIKPPRAPPKILVELISLPAALMTDVLPDPAKPNLPSSGFFIFNLSLLTFG